MLSLEDLFQYNRENKDVFESLSETISKDLYNVVPFVGAGMSYPIYPLWNEFISNAIKEGSIDEKNELLLWLKTGQKDLLEVASILKNRLGRKRYYNLLNKTFKEEKINEIAVKKMPIYLLPQIFEDSVIVTTNFDRIIETVYHYYDKDFEAFIMPMTKSESQLQKMESIRNSNHYLIKLHGDIRAVDKIVFSKEDYNETYGETLDSANIGYLSLLLQSKCMLFLGCSLKEDRTVEILRKLSLYDNYFPHYAIMEMKYEKDCKQYYEELKRISDMNIDCIWYPKQTHGYINIILENLIKKKYISR